MHWPQRNELILWELQDSPRALIESRGSLSQKTDVVEGDDVDGSTHLLTRSFVNEGIGVRLRVAARFVIRRRTVA